MGDFGPQRDRPYINEPIEDPFRKAPVEPPPPDREPAPDREREPVPAGE